MVFKKLLLFSSLFFTHPNFAAFAPVNYFSIRSQSFNTARHISGMSSHDLLYCCGDNFCGSFSVTPEYSRSFNPQSITESLFPNLCACNNVMRITGSRVENRQPTDLLADYFYLPTDFSSTVKFNPTIDNFLIDFNTTFYLDNIISGLSLAFYAPLVHTRWDLNMHENIIDPGANPHDAGYFSPQPIARGHLLADFTQYASGDTINPVVQVQDVNNAASNKIITVMQPLQYGLLSPKRLVKTRFAELRLIVGYNYISSSTYCCGFNIHIATPTGNRPQGTYLFEAIAGNGHHAELGGGITGFFIPYECPATQRQIVLRYDATATHIFPTRQKRVFDLHNKPLSRYMLAERLGTPVTSNLVGDTGGSIVTPSAQFKNEIAPLANLTHEHVQVSAAVQADITAVMTINSSQFSWDIGYSFWARSGEIVQRKGLNVLDNNTRWALKGDTFVYEFEATTPSFPAIAGSGTQSRATINHGLNFPASGTTDPAIIRQGQRNLGVDNAFPALSSATGTILTPDIPQPSPLVPLDQQSSTSINPILIATSDVSSCPASKTAPSLSSKFFTHANYSFDMKWSPFCGVGGQIEFFHPIKSSCNQDKVGPSRLNQWGVWLKVGFIYGS